MTPLSSCWLIIESIIIPEGILKWFFLSFYIHPVFLVFCQIFLWLKQGQNWVVFLISIIYKIIFHVVVYSFRILKKGFLFIFKFSGLLRTGKLVAEDDEEQSHDIFKNPEEEKHEDNETSIFLLPRIYFIEFSPILSFAESLETVETVDYFEAEETGTCTIEDSNDNGYSEDAECINSSDQTSMDSLISSQSSQLSDQELDYNQVLGLTSDNQIPNNQGLGYLMLAPSFPSMDLHTTQQHQLKDDSAGEEIDKFYLEYTEKMAWFDVLNQERLCGINAIEKKNLSADNLLIEQIGFSKMAKKRLIESMESDIELVYVAQTCLSWEALRHQYLKVEALSISSSRNGVFLDNVAGRFQQFQVLLERFVEDGRTSNGKRFEDYALKRSSVKNFLQVPQVSGFLSREDEGSKESTKVTEVVKTIERCIQAFWSYIITDAKESSRWKISKSSRFWKGQTPPVEDARDLHLLHDLINDLKKKERWLKDLRASQKNKLKKNDTTHEEVQENGVRFTMIDLILVKRVLKLSVISNSQLKWCHKKLSSIDFQGWTVIRRQELDHLFPS